MKRNILLLIASLYLTACSQHNIKKDTRYSFALYKDKWLAVKAIDSRSFESFPPKSRVQFYGDKEFVFVLEDKVNNIETLLENLTLNLYCYQNSQSSSPWRWKNGRLQVQCNQKYWKNAKVNKINFRRINND